ncbi:unnamed protein product [Moneuplotes crassus]|uniref:Uncharacterized protein n=1 Tax=Euplotes crassus TaxID=5936 RepID=A0AAD2D5U1_EUPCR|nr:unnamed protein product [Moneuplotes crassus]
MDENVLMESQIDKLTELKEYDYFWESFRTLCCKRVNFARKCNLCYYLDQSMTGELRCLCYIVFFPLILIVLILKLLLKALEVLTKVPNGKRKRLICLYLVSTTIFFVCTSIAVVVFFIIQDEKENIERYLTTNAFTNFQSISNATAQVKKADLQEITRELLILDALYSIILLNPEYYSTTYLSKDDDKLLSSTECSENETEDFIDHHKMCY